MPVMPRSPGRPRLATVIRVAVVGLTLVLAACGAGRTGPTPLAGPTTPTLTPSTAPSPTKRPPTRPKPELRTAPAQTATTRPASTTNTSTSAGGWKLASGGTGVVGTGSKSLIQYRVEVEQATNLSAASVAAVVDSTLANARGWTREGWRFQRVTLPTAEVDMVVRVATPATVDRICAEYGLNTGGQVSCRGGKYVMLNLTRWNIGVPDYADAVSQYRILLVNHEVGHLLNHWAHPPCPGAGKPQPVMMQVYYGGLQGCVRNVWPYAADGTLIG